MTKLVNWYCRCIEWIIVLALAAMVALVFGNVVLRYAFNSGITVSEELSRWLFVWTTFLGAIVALRERSHLGTDFLLAKLDVTGKKACLVISHVLMLYAVWVLWSGSLAQVKINMDTSAPVTGAPVAAFYASGLVFAGSAAVLLLWDLYRLVAGEISDADLVMVQESEEAAHPSPTADAIPPCKA